MRRDNRRATDSKGRPSGAQASGGFPLFGHGLKRLVEVLGLVAGPNFLGHFDKAAMPL